MATLPSPIPSLLSPQLDLLSANKLAREAEYDLLAGNGTFLLSCLSLSSMNQTKLDLLTFHYFINNLHTPSPYSANAKGGNRSTESP